MSWVVQDDGEVHIDLTHIDLLLKRDNFIPTCYSTRKKRLQ